MKFKLDDIIIFRDIDYFRRERVLGFIGDNYVLEIMDDSNKDHINKIIHMPRYIVEKISKLDIKYMKKLQFDKEMHEIANS